MRLVGVILILFLSYPGIIYALVDINTAGLPELQTLTGIGEVKAKAIVDYRSTNGYFSVKEDIMKVSGIASGTFAKIKNNISVSGGNSEPNDPIEENADTSDSDSDEDYEEAKREAVSDLELMVPEFVYVNQPVELAVTPTAGRRNRLVRYDWNFGDGHIGKGINPSHTYHHAGQYVVAVESYYLKKYLMVRKKITVLPVELSLTQEADGQLTVTNIGAREIDLYQMSLEGSEKFIFPKYSFLLPDASVTIAVEGSGSATLRDASGAVVAWPNQVVREAPLPAPPHRVVTSSVTMATSKETTKTTEAAQATTSVPRPIQPAINTAAVANGSSKPFEYVSYLGLAGIVLLGIYGIWTGRRSA